MTLAEATGSARTAGATDSQSRAGRGARTAAFHVLQVAEVERLCDDAVAVSFDVPPSSSSSTPSRPDSR